MIKTERVIVRKFTEEDIEDLYQVLSDSGVMVHIEPVFDRNKTKDFVSKYGLIDNPNIYAIEHINDNKVIGHFIENKSDNEWEIGWILNKAYWNRGIATEIGFTYIDYAKNSGCQKLILHFAEGQNTTKRIGEKLGFTLEESNVEERINLVKYSLILLD